MSFQTLIFMQQSRQSQVILEKERERKTQKRWNKRSRKEERIETQTREKSICCIFSSWLSKAMTQHEETNKSQQEIRKGTARTRSSGLIKNLFFFSPLTCFSHFGQSCKIRTVNNQVLIFSLSNVGTRKSTLTWFSSYLGSIQHNSPQSFRFIASSSDHRSSTKVSSRAALVIHITQLLRSPEMEHQQKRTDIW